MDVSSRVVDEAEGPLSSEESDVDLYDEDPKDFADVDSSGDDSDDESPSSAPASEEKSGSYHVIESRLPSLKRTHILVELRRREKVRNSFHPP